MINIQHQARLTELVNEMREIASRVGPMHSYWDVILDAEAQLRGEMTIIKMTPAERIKWIEQLLRDRQRTENAPDKTA